MFGTLAHSTQKLSSSSKTDPTAHTTPEPTPSHAPISSHHRHHSSKDSLNIMNSPFINRRPLSPKTEQELRSACALILQDFKPSDHDIPDAAKPRLDTNGMRRKDHGSDAVRVRRPTGAPADLRSAHGGHKHGHKTMKEESVELPVQAITGRRREQTESAQIYGIPPPFVLPSASAIRDLMDNDSDSSINSPVMSSIGQNNNNGSTAPTSAALTSSRSSKRASRQFDNAAAVADAQAAEWMRQELEKRRHKISSNPHPDIPPLTRAPSRPSRSRSIRSDIKGYIFPSSTALSRTASKAGSKQISRRESHESMRSESSSQEPKRSGSSQGWRSWGLQHKLSSRSSSRPGTSKGRIETLGLDKKSDLNLNRELPPLPSLDTWKPEEPTSTDSRRSPAPGEHIANLMRPQDQDQQRQDYVAAVRRHHRKSGSDTLAMKYTTYSPPSAQVARSVSQRNPQLVLTPKRTATTVPLDTAMDFDELMSAMDVTNGDFNDQLTLTDGRSPPHSATFDPHSLQSPTRSMKMSCDQSRPEVPPNFSRKISADILSSAREDPSFANILPIDASAQKVSQKSKIKKVFSAWMVKKEKKKNWMDQLEKNGIKTGVMVQDESALPPVVRY
jgi:hypothetical protein